MDDNYAYKRQRTAYETHDIATMTQDELVSTILEPSKRARALAMLMCGTARTAPKSQDYSVTHGFRGPGGVSLIIKTKMR